MKHLILSFLLVFFNLSYSQIKIDSNLLVSDYGGDLISLQLEVKNLNLSKSKNKILDVDSLYSLKYRKAKKRIFYFYIKLYENTALYRDKYYSTRIGFIREIVLLNDTISVNFVVEGDDRYCVKIYPNKDDTFNVIFVKNINRKKPKIYFSYNTTLTKISF